MGCAAPSSGLQWIQPVVRPKPALGHPAAAAASAAAPRQQLTSLTPAAVPHQQQHSNAPAPQPQHPLNLLVSIAFVQTHTGFGGGKDSHVANQLLEAARVSMMPIIDTRHWPAHEGQCRKKHAQWVVAGQHTHGGQAWLGRGQLPQSQATTIKTGGLTRSLLLLSVCVCLSCRRGALQRRSPSLTSWRRWTNARRSLTW